MSHGARRRGARARQENARRLEIEVTALVSDAVARLSRSREDVPSEVLVAECLFYLGGPYRRLIDPYVAARLLGRADSGG